MIYTYGYLFYIPITLIFSSIFIFYGIKNKKGYPFYFCAAVAVLYINIAIKAAVFPIIIENIAEFNIAYNINWTNINWEREWGHNLLNILLTFPIGFGIQFIFAATLKKRIIISALCGSCFELFQLMLLVLVKPINIIFDINDLISNVLGALLGLLAIQIINIAVRKMPPLEGTSIRAYLYTICSHS